MTGFQTRRNCDDVMVEDATTVTIEEGQGGKIPNSEQKADEEYKGRVLRSAQLEWRQWRQRGGGVKARTVD